MDRLLSEEQIKQIRLLPENENNTYSEMMVAVAKDQLTKTDEEWVEWIKTFIYNEYGTIMIQDNCFQERMKEIGYE